MKVIMQVDKTQLVVHAEELLPFVPGADTVLTDHELLRFCQTVTVQVARNDSGGIQICFMGPGERVIQLAPWLGQSEGPAPHRGERAGSRERSAGDE